MDHPVDLLNQALILYREEMERNSPEDPEIIRQQLSAEMKAALPENVREYLKVTRLPNDGHQFQLIIPGCLPVSLSFTQRISGLELELATVVNEETRKPWSSSNLMLVIGCARDLYLQSEVVIDERITSDIESRLIVLPVLPASSA